MAAKIDFEAKQGVTFRRVLTYKGADGALIDLTDFTARMQVRDGYEGEAVLELDTENGGITLGGAEGTMSLFVSAVEMAAVPVVGGSGEPPVKVYVYDIELVKGDDVFAFAEGKFSVKREVTR